MTGWNHYQSIVARKALVLGALLAVAYFVSMSDPSGCISNHEHGLLTAQQLQAISLGGSSSSSSSNHSVSAGGDRRLRVFMSAPSPHINLCKSAMSAVAAGYPAPILLNWAGEFSHPRRRAAKLEGLLAVIDDLLARAEGEDGDAHEEDLAVLVDAHQVWFQLPPSVLVQRYHELNGEADQRLRRQWEAARGDMDQPAGHPFPVDSPRQSVIVTTAEDCHPGTGSDSTAPSDRYGRQTERLFSSSSLSSWSVQDLDPARYRCLNSAMIMGTMGSLRHVLRRAKAKTDTAAQRGRHGQTWGNDQALLAEVLREQDLWRAWMRNLGASWNGTVSQNDLSRLPRHVRAVAKASMAGDRFEYGIGLGIGLGNHHHRFFSAMPPIADADADADADTNTHAHHGAFVTINNATALQEASTIPGLVPDELSQKNVGATHLEAVQWAHLPLYSDLYHGVTPVGLYFNNNNNNNNNYDNDVDTDKSKANKKDARLTDYWTSMWFYPHLRNLIAHATLPPSHHHTIRPLARIQIPTQLDPSTRPDAPRPDQIRYWAPKSNYRHPEVQVFAPHAGHGAMSDSDSSGGSYGGITWEGICQGDTPTPWHEQIFGDAKGPWQL
ncbi:hypothetical protein E4U55_004221 [Claviceps digitariae]|nr:hypothetical protein E4U55_004221 [Claviceps digitariae]